MWAANVSILAACYISFKIAPDYRPRTIARIKPTTLQIYNNINSDNKIWNLAH